MLGFGELFAHEAAFRLGWGGTKARHLFLELNMNYTNKLRSFLLLEEERTLSDLVSSFEKSTAVPALRWTTLQAWSRLLEACIENIC